MIYEQAVFVRPGRERTAEAMLREHFKRVSEDLGYEFGEVRISLPRLYAPGQFIMFGWAPVTKQGEQGKVSMPNDIEAALADSMWSTLH